MKSNHLIEQEELMAYLDGELATDRAAVAVAHLERCQECQELAAALRSVSEQMREWQAGDAPPAMPPVAAAAALNESQDVKRVPKTLQRRWFGLLQLRISSRKMWLFGGAATFAVLLIAVITSNNLTSPRKWTVGVAEQPILVPPRKEASETDDLTYGVSLGERLKTKQSEMPRSQFRSYDLATTAGATQQQVDDTRDKGRELPNSGPMIIRSASLNLVAKDFDRARAGLEDSLRRHRGYIGELNTSGASGNARGLNAKLRVPADQLDAVISELKQLGHVDSESQSGEEVTQQYVDLQARIENGRHTEQQLTEILRDRTGKLADVLSVEREIDRVRGEIERMEAERKSLADQVDFATLNVSVSEDYKTPIQTVVPLSTSTRLHNAAVEGYQTVVNGIITLLLFLASAGPTILIWCAILFFPVRAIWRKVRKLTTAV